MTEPYKRVIANLILDYFFANESVHTFESGEVLDYIIQRVRANTGRDQLILVINNVAGDLRSAGVLVVTGQDIAPAPSYYSASLDTWQPISNMNSNHIANALQKMLREEDIMRRRTEAKWLIAELGRRAVDNGS